MLYFGGQIYFLTFLVQLEMLEVPVMYEPLCAKLLNGGLEIKKKNKKKRHGPEMCLKTQMVSTTMG